MYGLCSNNALSSESLSFIFIFLLTPFDTSDYLLFRCYYFKSNLTLVLLMLLMSLFLCLPHIAKKWYQTWEAWKKDKRGGWPYRWGYLYKRGLKRSAHYDPLWCRKIRVVLSLNFLKIIDLLFLKWYVYCSLKAILPTFRTSVGNSRGRNIYSYYIVFRIGYFSCWDKEEFWKGWKVESNIRRKVGLVN